MKYHEQEEKLFRRWSTRARKLHDADMIAKDGLLYRGELRFDVPEKGTKEANFEFDSSKETAPAVIGV